MFVDGQGPLGNQFFEGHGPQGEMGVVGEGPIPGVPNGLPGQIQGINLQPVRNVNVGVGRSIFFATDSTEAVNEAYCRILDSVLNHINNRAGGRLENGQQIPAGGPYQIKDEIWRVDCLTGKVMMVLDDGSVDGLQVVISLRDLKGLPNPEDGLFDEIMDDIKLIYKELKLTSRVPDYLSEQEPHQVGHCRGALPCQQVEPLRDRLLGIDHFGEFAKNILPMLKAFAPDSVNVPRTLKRMAAVDLFISENRHALEQHKTALQGQIDAIEQQPWYDPEYPTDQLLDYRKEMKKVDRLITALDTPKAAFYCALAHWDSRGNMTAREHVEFVKQQVKKTLLAMAKESSGLSVNNGVEAMIDQMAEDTATLLFRPRSAGFYEMAVGEDPASLYREYMDEHSRNEGDLTPLQLMCEMAVETADQLDSEHAGGPLRAPTDVERRFDHYFSMQLDRYNRRVGNPLPHQGIDAIRDARDAATNKARHVLCTANDYLDPANGHFQAHPAPDWQMQAHNIADPRVVLPAWQFDQDMAFPAGHNPNALSKRQLRTIREKYAPMVTGFIGPKGVDTQHMGAGLANPVGNDPGGVGLVVPGANPVPFVPHNAALGAGMSGYVFRGEPKKKDR
ncbi:MAG: hypothetical protein S4CHLAM102_04720 [Chlamydiia bacterium]|nr:hypothetical protein [Chlamydiia bacterium]